MDSIRFMSSGFGTLSRNFFGVHGMVWEECRSKAELTYIDKSYVTHGTCGKCWGTTYQKSEIGPIFDNLRVSCKDEQFQLLPRKGVYP